MSYFALSASLTYLYYILKQSGRNLILKNQSKIFCVKRQADTLDFPMTLNIKELNNVYSAINTLVGFFWCRPYSARTAGICSAIKPIWFFHCVLRYESRQWTATKESRNCAGKMRAFSKQEPGTIPSKLGWIKAELERDSNRKAGTCRHENCLRNSSKAERSLKACWLEKKAALY